MSVKVYEKLMIARQRFLETPKKMSGLNPYAEFEYFELKDIVPVASKIFSELGLVFIVDFPEGRACGKLIDVEDESFIEVGFTYKSIAEPAKLRMNEVQGVGSEITYYRRYLYLMLLDIVDCDAIDKTSGAPAEAPAKKTAEKPKSKKPVTQEERSEIKKTLTSAPAEPAKQEDVSASEEDVNALKALCKELIAKAPDKQEFVQAAALKTKGFTAITKSQCDALIAGVKELIAHYVNN